MDDSPELEMALQIPGEMEMVALAIPDALLLELDIYCDSLRMHPRVLRRSVTSLCGRSAAT